MRRNNPFDHQSIGSKSARAAERKSGSRAPRPRAQIKAAARRGQKLQPGVGEIAVKALCQIVLNANETKPRARLLEADSATRKRYPITTGVLDYFPDAIPAIAEVSFLGNAKHNPGEALHWARGKSMDHADCIMRHLAERGGFEIIVINGVEYKVRHSAALAWRANALLQEELEQEFSLALPRGARVDLPVTATVTKTRSGK